MLGKHEGKVAETFPQCTVSSEGTEGQVYPATLGREESSLSFRDFNSGLGPMTQKRISGLVWSKVGLLVKIERKVLFKKTRGSRKAPKLH